MNEKLLQQAMEMFDSQEKWDAFLELLNVKGDIFNRWLYALKDEIKRLYGLSLTTTNKWEIDDRWPFIRIYTRPLSDDMDFRINLQDRTGYLYLNLNKYDMMTARQMILNNSKLMSLLEGFEYNNTLWGAVLSKPFAKDISSHSCDSSCYIWGHDTERVANVLFETYIQPFMTDEIADFIVKVCEESKKQ